MKKREMGWNNYGVCTLPECNFRFTLTEKTKILKNRNVRWNCDEVNLMYNPGNELEIIEYCLHSTGTLIGYFDLVGEDHSMLIIGTTSNGDLLVKNSWNDGVITINLYPRKIQSGLYVDESDLDDRCINNDGDAYCFWGIKGLRYPGSKPSSCNGLSCSSPKMDCNDEDSTEWGCQFSCGNGYCDPWENCHFCFDDCWISGENEKSSFCCGDDVCDENYGETCDLCAQDCCPYFENGICDYTERCGESSGDCIGEEGGCGAGKLCTNFNPNTGELIESCSLRCDSESNAAWFRIECPQEGYLDITGDNNLGQYFPEYFNIDPHEEEWRCCELI